jgi:putative addiction module component (TIGR02574 family)
MKIQELSISDLIILAEKLWDSIIDEDAIELPENQKIELDRRLQAFINDQDVGSSWHEVKERVIREYCFILENKTG